MDTDGTITSNSTPPLTPQISQDIYDMPGKPSEVFVAGNFYWTHVSFTFDETVRVIREIDVIMFQPTQPATKNDLVALLSSDWLDVEKIVDDYIAEKGCGTDYECFKNLYKD